MLETPVKTFFRRNSCSNFTFEHTSNTHPTCKCLHPTHQFILLHSRTLHNSSRIGPMIPQPIPALSLSPPEPVPSVGSPVSPSSAISTPHNTTTTTTAISLSLERNDMLSLSLSLSLSLFRTVRRRRPC